MQHVPCSSERQHILKSCTHFQHAYYADTQIQLNVPMNILILALMLSQVEPNTEAQYAQYNEFTKFDRYFSKYSKRYFGIAFD